MLSVKMYMVWLLTFSIHIFFKEILDTQPAAYKHKQRVVRSAVTCEQALIIDHPFFLLVRACDGHDFKNPLARQKAMLFAIVRSKASTAVSSSYTNFDSLKVQGAGVMHW
jgi:hypothetical protein